MPRKRTQKKPTAVPDVAGFFRAFGIAIQKFFVAIWTSIKIVARAILILLDKILRFVIALVLALAKIIRAVALVFASIFAALALLALAFFLFSRAVDLPNSENFQNIRERSFEILGQWLEPEFTASEARAAAWAEYREALKAAYRAEISSEAKIQMVQDARNTLRSVLQETDPDAFRWLR